jgi:hypothetical protein
MTGLFRCTVASTLHAGNPLMPFPGANQESGVAPQALNAPQTFSNRFTLTGCGVRSSWA